MNILFIGNSYTYYNDMPAIFEAFAAAAGVPCRVKSITRGGAWIWQYLREEDEVGMRIREALKEPWDYVIWQDNSFAPIGALQQFLQSAETLAGMIREAGAAPVLYQTMPYKLGHPKYEEYRLTQADMQQRLRDGYQLAAERTGARLSTAGEAFYAAIPKYGMALHNEDMTHPAPAGSYLLTAVHIGAVLGVDPRTVNFDWALEPDLAADLRRRAAAALGLED